MMRTSYGNVSEVESASLDIWGNGLSGILDRTDCTKESRNVLEHGYGNRYATENDAEEVHAANRADTFPEVGACASMA